MKVYFIFYMIILSIDMKAQCKDSVVASIHYISSIKIYLEKDTKEAEMVLDITNGKTVFYDRWRQERQEKIDSVKNAHGSLAEMQNAIASLPNSTHFFYIFNNIPQKGVRTYKEWMGKDFYYTEDIEPINWLLTSKDSTIAEYNCHSAEGVFRGHKWRVYYTTDIPFSVGPWKLYGLPGAIMYAREESGNFVFDAIEVKTSPKKLIELKLSQTAIRCTREEFKLMKKEEANNPNVFFKKRFGLNNHAYNADGTPLIYKHKTALFMED
jgi:GLPGLI family protein